MASQFSAADRYQLALEAWSLVDTAYRQQQASGVSNEAAIDALSEGADHVFFDALAVVPGSLQELRSYLAMLEKRNISENPEAVSAALKTIGRAVADLSEGSRCPTGRPDTDLLPRSS